ncbi:MAG: type II toxin-antitoxin system RelE/ParE family toxin [Candidatus Levybacteria bacterium]|nr:type II toxin-antitoxin system RelE/ParE family toxin [Candidatus Levybacteria bacterium]
MPAKTLILPKKTNRKISKLPLRIQNKIDEAFDKIKQNPNLGIKLHGDLAGYYKFRVGDYRIIYEFNKELSILEIIKVEHRQGVYR